MNKKKWRKQIKKNDEILRKGKIFSSELAFSYVIFKNGNYSNMNINNFKNNFLYWVAEIEEKFATDNSITLLNAKISINKKKKVFQIENKASLDENDNYNDFENAIYSWLKKGESILFFNYFIIVPSKSKRDDFTSFTILNISNSRDEIEKINEIRKNLKNSKNKEADFFNTRLISKSKFKSRKFRLKKNDDKN